MKRFILLLLVMVLTACGTHSGPAPAPPPTSQTTIIPDTTKVTDPVTRTALTAYDRTSGVLRFSQSTPVLAALKPGDVLVSGPSSAAPNGYLRKITGVRRDGGDVVLDTSQAKLTEAVSQGVLDAHISLTPAQVKRTEVFLPGVTVTSNAPHIQGQDQVGIGENYEFSATFNHVFVPQAGPNLSGQMTVDGSVSYNVGLGVYIAVSGPSFIPPRLISVGPVEAKVGFAQQASLHISGDVTGDLGDEFKFATQYFEPLTFFIGPVPVIVVPRLDLYLSAGGHVEGKFDFQASESTAAQLGARWTPDDGWKNISDFGFSGDLPRPTVFGTIKPRAGVKSTFGFKLYDVAGPEMSLLGGLELDGQIPRNPNWILNGFLKGSMNFKVELPILGTLADYQVTLFDKTLEFARAGNTPPILELTDLAKPTGIAVIDGTKTAFLGLRVPMFMGNGCVQFNGFPVVAYYRASDLEDACNLAVTVVSDKDGPLPTTGKYAFGSEGQRRITITVRDSQGTAASKSFLLYILNADPTLTLQHAGDPQQGEAYTIAAQISDPNESNSAALCANTTWAVDAPDVLSNSSGCLQNVTFGTTGARQVRVTTRDSDGGVTAQTLTLNVLPPPANPYPRITSKGVYSRDTRGTGAFRFCADVPINDGDTIDFSLDGCTLIIVGDPPRRFSAKVTVENPANEALTYAWKLYGPGDNLLDTSTSPRFELLPSVGGNNTNPITTACSITVTVSVADPTRSKTALVWSGKCTYFSNRVA
ncbi:hypothetical protein GCM10022631_07360 [Deinococcus rubellus]|uniref:hypothetical protein n=1 Tax=Deinococcus rubellus TaxID=1889240 RepID=UPI0031F0BB40